MAPPSYMGARKQSWEYLESGIDDYHKDRTTFYMPGTHMQRPLAIMEVGMSMPSVYVGNHGTRQSRDFASIAIICLLNYNRLGCTF